MYDCTQEANIVPLYAAEPYRDALLQVTSCRAILDLLVFQRESDGSGPIARELLPSSPATPAPELRDDRSLCALELFEMVYDETSAAALVDGDHEKGPDISADSRDGSARPGVVCVVGSSGVGKSFLMQEMLGKGIHCVSPQMAAAADPAFLDWLRSAVVTAVNFNSYFKISFIEAKLVEDEKLTFEDLVRLRLVYGERADLNRLGKKAFDSFITCVNFALREGKLSSRLIEEDATDLMLARAGRGAPSDALIILVDEVAKIGNIKGGPVLPLRRHIIANSDLYEDDDGQLPSVVAFLVSACCHVAHDGEGSVLCSSTESRLVQDGATVLSGRDAPNYNNLVEDPEDCIPLCLAALVRLAKRGLYLFSREVSSHELADVLQRDFHSGGGVLSARGEELLTPIAPSLEYATGIHLRTAVKLFMKVSTAKEGAEVSTMLSTITSPDFSLSLSTVWDVASVDDRNNFMATLILQDKVSYADMAFPSLVGKLPGSVSPVWDYVRRRGIVFGSGSPFAGRLSPIMLRQVLARPSSNELALKACLDVQVQPSDAPSWMRWESVCGCHEWARSIARSRKPSRFAAVSLGELFGKNSTYCGGGGLLGTMLVDASVARKGVGCHNLQTLLSWEGTKREADLVNRVWLLTENTYGVDAMFFFRCVRCIHKPELQGKLIAVGIQNKFRNLVGDIVGDRNHMQLNVTHCMSLYFTLFDCNVPPHHAKTVHS